MPLETGQYEANTRKKVTVWPAPDKNGDGDALWENKLDNAGNVVGRNAVKDKDGNPVHVYNPPEGFTEVASFDHTSSYVRTDERGRVLRNPNGEAVGIQPGTTLVEYADGTHELLTDEYSQYLFEQAHEKVSE